MKTKKELKAAYKQQEPQMGVFQVLNKKSGMVLVEGATDMPAKWNRHRTELRFGSHRNKILQADWNRIGEENFEYSVVSKLQIDNEVISDFKSEVKLFAEMVLEEMNIQAEQKY